MLINRIERLIRYVLREPGWLHLAVGLPALLTAIVCVAVWTFSQSLTSWDLSKHYFRAAMHAHRQGDIESAERWLRKVTHLNANDPAARFRLAKIAMQKGETIRARRLLAELAPRDAIGFPPAHLFVASQLLKSAAAGSAQTESATRWHLSAALAKNPSDLHARHMLAEFELMHRSLQDAIAHYRVLEPRDPSVNLLLAQLHVAIGNRAQAELAAERGLRRFSKRIADDHTDVAAKIESARLYAFLEIYDEATRILNNAAAFQRIPPDDLNRLRHVLSDIYFQWNLALRHHGSETDPERLHLLKLAVKLTPEDHRLYQSLFEIKRSSQGLSEPVDEVFRSLLTQSAGNQPTGKSIVHLNLSIAAANEGDATQERRHLREALRADPKSSVAANNLAWNLATAQPPRLDEAMQWVDRAIELQPQRDDYRATRGRILALSGRKQEAIAELEPVSRRLPGRADISRVLAELYRDLGDESAAGEHTARAAAQSDFGRL
ncbi:tetratricopeptide repeat protein [Roseiconus nitratireducens]|uniref:Tetratricopeptide repeat protein n=1 Tax=Roseiconus nitratireducens TaxID=2605748 RepID=A0A5M6CZJ0_9BACT|nr:tetratricopeptide repeat protein [Roseiconus nitratireducens]KAA5540644.1 tetratricopeptide repeat protein [Roseiconus nitratireducens]